MASAQHQQCAQSMVFAKFDVGVQPITGHQRAVWVDLPSAANVVECWGVWLAHHQWLSSAGGLHCSHHWTSVGNDSVGIWARASLILVCGQEQKLIGGKMRKFP